MLRTDLLKNRTQIQHPRLTHKSSSNWEEKDFEEVNRDILKYFPEHIKWIKQTEKTLVFSVHTSLSIGSASLP